jgi:hypothetical protein
MGATQKAPSNGSVLKPETFELEIRMANLHYNKIEYYIETLALLIFPCSCIYFCIWQNYGAAEILQTIAIAGKWTKVKKPFNSSMANSDNNPNATFCSNDHTVPFCNTLYSIQHWISNDKITIDYLLVK